MATATSSLNLADISTLAIAIMALGFTVGSFWWLNARTGKLIVATPSTYAYAGPAGTLRLRLPLTFYNTGARDLMIEDLQIRSTDIPSMLRWITTRTMIKPDEDDGHEFPKSFAVSGRGTRELVVEFGNDSMEWRPEPGGEYQLILEARLPGSEGWVELSQFAWWAPTQHTGRYIAHRNEQPDA